MPSAGAEAPRRAGRAKSLSRRVALASALAAAVGGATAALAAGTAATGLLAAHDDATLRAAAIDLASEVEEEVIEDREEHGFTVEGVPMNLVYEKALVDEIDDVDLPGARARIDRPEGHVAGDPSAPRPPIGTCEDAKIGEVPVRACTVAAGAWTLSLATSAYGIEVREDLLSWSVLLGIAIGALLGGLASHRASVWALRPLLALSERVRRVEPADPHPSVLEPALAHEELEALRVAVVHLVEQLGEALASARGFAAEAAHELRTPLTTIAGELELLAETATPEDALAVGQARRRVDDLVTLVQRLLILAQSDPLAGAGADAVDLADVLDAVQGALPAERRARLDADVEDDVLVRGDPALLGALLTNAVDNALKFSEGPVRVGIRRVAGEALVEVIDAGPGIAEEERERVFEPFYRSRVARRSGALGHGVGLALIAHVARVHGGRARIDSKPGEGTRLEVRLPGWAPKTEPSGAEGRGFRAG
jgi:signal transduction histidine kinase